MNNISQIKNCYGCGVCSIICPKNIISISLNEDGFYQPIVNNEKCIECGLCIDVCSYSDSNLSLSQFAIRSYGAWSNDAVIRRKCSSGGVGFEIGRTLLSQGYKVCGVRYNTEIQRAEHFIAYTEKELLTSIGSKYLQSYTVDGFKNINKKEKYLVVGTPCQIDSLRRLVKKWHAEDNFVLVDFFCHGVPSMLMWKKYVNYVETITGPIVYASWRNKFIKFCDNDIKNGDEVKIDWHKSLNMLIKGKIRSYNSQSIQGDAFYNLFLGNFCLGKACYDKCKFKYKHSSADIRIGDMWGSVYKDNEEGISAVVSFTKKGDNLLQKCNIKLCEYPFELVAEGQMKTKIKQPSCYLKVMNFLKSENIDINWINSYIVRYKRKQFMIKLLNPFFAFKYVTNKLLR